MTASISLAPIFPVNLLRYGLGVTGISFRVYFLTAFLVALPGAVLYAGLGHVLRQAVSEGRVSPVTIVLVLALGVACILGGLYLKRRMAGAKLNLP